MLPTIPGMVPNLLDLPAGCAFQDRCPQVHEHCRREEPPLAEVASRHAVRCWLHVA
jgi:oligopeptide/dipeptide ABC transporter ATP-binding protein